MSEYIALFDLSRDDGTKVIWSVKAGEKFDAETAGVTDIEDLLKRKVVKPAPVESPAKKGKDKS